MTGRLRSVAWLAFLTVTLVMLTRLDHGVLAGPGLQPDGWLRWLSGDPASRAVALVRVAAWLCTSYLTAVTGLGIVARALSWRPAIRALDVVTPRLMKRVLYGGMAVTMSWPAALASAQEQTPRPPVMTLLRPGQAAMVVTTTSSTLVAARPDTPQPAPSAPAHDSDARASADNAGSTWTVRPGDHLWSIAEKTLAARRGRAVTDEEIAPYWRTLVKANASRLADPQNPDLLFTGQVMRTPN